MGINFILSENWMSKSHPQLQKYMNFLTLLKIDSGLSWSYFDVLGLKDFTGGKNRLFEVQDNFEVGNESGKNEKV